MKKVNEMKEKKSLNIEILFVFAFLLLLTGFAFAATPDNPAITPISNETTTNSYSGMFNISGGYISTINLDATFQNPRWKAFIGNVTGKYTLDDSTGQTIFDWTFATITGRVYSTRDSGDITWGSIDCADGTAMSTENSALVHSNQSSDNLTRTFNDTTHSAFWAAGKYIGTDSCSYSVATYVNDAPQGASPDFEEIVLSDGSSIVYATIIEDNVVGYNGETYDFQMIVPENASSAFAGATPYYMYVELD